MTQPNRWTLTDEHRKRIPEWNQEWIAKIMDESGLDEPALRDAIENLYRVSGLKIPRVVIVPSPLVGALATMAATEAATGAATGAATRDATWAATRDATRNIWKHVNQAYHGGNEWLSYCCYLSFVRDIIGWKCPEHEKYRWYEQAGILGGVRFMRNSVCFVSRKPKRKYYMDMNGRYVLHCNGGPAVDWGETQRIYALNGVIVPQWLAEERAESVDTKRIFDIDNVEVRREFVHKIGVDRIAYTLGGKSIDKKVIEMDTPIQRNWPCQYEIMELDYGNGARRRVLKMQNPSLPDIVHFEYVPMECNTVESAMNFRLNRDESDIDDENGSDWYLHGDVILTPEGAKNTKRWPKMIA